MRKIIFNTALLTCILGGSQTVFAANDDCVIRPNFQTIIVPINMGRIFVRPSDPVGAKLHEQVFSYEDNGSRIYCPPTSPNNYGMDFFIEHVPLGTSHIDSIFPSSVPGIGIRISFAYPNGETERSYPYLWWNRPFTGEIGPYRNRTLKVEIFKTAENTGSGSLKAGNYSKENLTLFPNNPFMRSVVSPDGIIIDSTACELQGSADRIIELSPTTVADFSGIGTTLAEQAFSLDLLCNGSFSIVGSSSKINLGISFDFQQYGNDNSAIRNTANDNEKASGVNLQLTTGIATTARVVRNGEKVPVTSLTSAQNQLVNIPMTARYIQSEAKVTGGKVSGVATFTLQYE